MRIIPACRWAFAGVGCLTSFLLTLALLNEVVVAAAAPPPTQPVTAREGTPVTLDNEVPGNPAPADVVSPDASGDGTIPGTFKIVSKTFKPPNDSWTFQPFSTGTHVDVQNDPDSMFVERDPDTTTSVRVTLDDIPSNAGEFGLRCEGNLTPPSGGSGPGNTAYFWRARADKEGVAITKVPQYLYADATAAVPVTFKFFGLGNAVEIRNPKITFMVDNQTVVNSYDVTGKFTAGNGLGVTSGNGTSDTYTAWVNISEFQTVQLADFLSDNCYFKIEVEAKKDGEWYNYTSAPDDESAHPDIFGDARVNVVEIGVDKSWTPRNPQLLQDRLKNLGQGRYDHVGADFGYDEPFPHSGESVANGGCGEITLTFYDFTVTCHDSIDLAAEMGAKVGLRHPPWQEAALGQYMASWRYGVTDGVWFGASYGHVAVPILSADGMDLTVSSGKGNLTLFPTGYLSYALGASDNDGAGIGTVAVDVLQLGWTLTKKVPIVGQIIGLAVDIVKAVNEQYEYRKDTEEAVCYFIYGSCLPGHNTWDFEYYMTGFDYTAGSQAHVNASMSKVDVAVQVGEAKEFVFDVNCAVSNAIDYFFYAYTVTATMSYNAPFTDANSVIWHSAP